MSAGVHTERRFEDAVEDHLHAAGWNRGVVNNYDRKLALDTAEMFAFIDDTQAKAWARLVTRYGGDPATARREFARLAADELDHRGTVDVLRRGIKVKGETIRLAFFAPAHALTEATMAAYAANRLTLTRQLPYSPDHHNTLDLALFVNGVPTATAELKNPLTGQDVEDAKEQYRRDRDPHDRLLAKRAVVHFAVDPDLVFLTTRLAGAKTRFLPFNQGNGGPGRPGGAGNPTPADGYATTYLWERVWARDAWLELLARFVHAAPAEGGAKRAAKAKPAQREIIFPRYHQWDAVLALLAHAREHGAGHNYLVEHSAGSGKSNTIAWLVHRLMSLHTADNRKVFSKVIVITDRVVLDKQLQDTIFQFDHTPGVVARIDKHSTQLAEALAGGTAQIIITTLQKFPFVLDQVSGLTDANYAIIVDEAHSSQTGETAKALKAVLGAGAAGEGDELTDAALEAAEKFDTALEDANDPQEALVASLSARGRQPNLSYFAFTATPKAKTLELFGTRVETPAGAELRPFHLYSMRQAIEEGFILDVLKNYMTYKTYWRLANAAVEDPEVDKGKAAAALARFVSLHPTNLAQKAEIIVEHFRRHTAAKIGGQAKAMVVTRSRLHAVRYKQSIDAYLTRKGYADLRALVAFSGQVIDADTGGADVVYTEAGMNGFAERELPERFDSDDYQVLVVAEKYQTGYDQPLLHTMYLDRKLEGVKAVQTLSRLNRTAPGKVDTFVLDFVNTAEDIAEQFKPFYETTITEPTDEHLLYAYAGEIDGYAVIAEADADAFVAALTGAGAGGKAHASLYAHLAPAVTRFKELSVDDQDEFRRLLAGYTRAYAFLAQVLSFGDPDLERLYLYARYLLLRLPGRPEPTVDLGEDVRLSHLRIEATGLHDVSLGEGSGDQMLPGFTGEGTGRQNEPEKIRLSQIIDTLNDRFGTNLTQADQLYFDQLEQALTEDTALAAQAQANTEENFAYGFDKTFEGAVIDRQTANEDLFRRLMDDDEFNGLVKVYLRRRVYQRLTEDAESA
ncbi:type I restriction endonuclease subunit R [Blastococcus sp. SYSU DS1024]